MYRNNLAPTACQGGVVQETAWPLTLRAFVLRVLNFEMLRPCTRRMLAHNLVRLPALERTWFPGGVVPCGNRVLPSPGTI